MQRELVCSKIHKATVTEANIAYVGSITIDSSLMEMADIWPGQKVLVVSNTSGARLETYTIKGRPNSGEVCINGAAAHLIKEGEEVIIIAFAYSDKPIEAKCLLVDEANKFVKFL